MKNSLFISIFILISVMVFSQERAFVIYNAEGDKVSYQTMLDDLTSKDIILFGELHNNPIAHWLQLELTTDLHKLRDIILGAEMIETDNQDELDRYLDGKISYNKLDSIARLWPNYKTDYAPLVDFAKDNNLRFIGTNIPRRYAKLVYSNGFEILKHLSEKEKSWIAPQPIPFDSELPTYKNILKMMGDHGSPELVMAQATKDATMASSILKNYLPDHLFIHYNGAYHSDKYEGILWYLKKEMNDGKYGTISTVSQEDINTLKEENQKIADYIICVDSDMTTTY